MSKLAVYALGGNALQTPDGDKEETASVLAKVMSDVVDLLEMDWGVVVTHGNGPQVGHFLALDRDRSHGLDAWVAATQGTIGHQLSLHLQSILERRRRPERTVVVLTHTEVDADDEGFSLPTKPVGPVLDAATVMSADWDIAQTIHGARRVVASPAPVRVVEIDVIRHLVSLQAVVICGGGGGIPIVS
ncbi:MAG: carbamate kinase, partial [archaeon]|nr:carbamate kinase [archaeon]